MQPSQALPRHGTRARKRAFQCQCTACSTKKLRKEGSDAELRWTFTALVEAIGGDTLREWYDAEQMTEWRSHGLTDEEADTVAITLGHMPWEIWGGWIEAGLDMEEAVDGAE